VEDETVLLVRPLTYMNRSGGVLPGLLADHDAAASDLLVLVDDVSLPPGKFRLRARGSAGGHNGLASIEAALESRQYGRLRIGVGAPEHDDVDLAAWVLAPPRGDEESAVLEEMDRMAEAVECWLSEGMGPAMNRFN
jgi:PTH1 family peptidyl-tRNA hydrolase